MPDARPFGWMVAIASIVTATPSWAPPAAAATLEVGAGKTTRPPRRPLRWRATGTTS